MPLNFSAQSFFTTTSRMFYRCKKWFDISTKMHLRSRFKQFQTGQNRRQRTFKKTLLLVQGWWEFFSPIVIQWIKRLFEFLLLSVFKWNWILKKWPFPMCQRQKQLHNEAAFYSCCCCRRQLFELELSSGSWLLMIAYGFALFFFLMTFAASWDSLLSR